MSYFYILKNQKLQLRRSQSLENDETSLVGRTALFFGVFARDREIADDLTMGKHCFRRCLTHFGEYKPLLSQPSLDSCIHLYKHLLEYTDDSSHNICIVKFCSL